MPDLTRRAQGLPSAHRLLLFPPCLLACLQKYVQKSMQRCLAADVQAGMVDLSPRMSSGKTSAVHVRVCWPPWEAILCQVHPMLQDRTNPLGICPSHGRHGLSVFWNEFNILAKC